MGSARATFVCMGAFCMLFLCTAAPARADTPIDADRPPVRRWFSLWSDRDEGAISVGVVAMNMALPRFGVNGDSISHRFVGVAAPPSSGWFYGGRVGFTGRRDALMVEILELSYMQTAGGSSLATSANGQTVLVTRDAFHKLDIGGLGVGVQAIAPSGKAKLSLKLDWGFSVLWSDAHVSGGGEPSSNGVTGDGHAFARVELAACGRSSRSIVTDWRTWGCLTVGTNIYEETWLNGVAVGARADF